MKRIFFIYRTVNKVNNKKYYGKHSTYDMDDGYIGSGTILCRSIKKYSKDSFRRDILMFFDSESDLNKYEMLFINESLVSKDDVYNIAIGGQGGHLGPLWYEKHKQAVNDKEYKFNMSIKTSGINNGFFNKAHSDTVKYNLSKLNTGTQRPSENYDYHREHFNGAGNPFHGKHHSEKTKNILSQKQSKAIFIDDIEYKSTKEASEKLSIATSTINYRLKSKNFSNYKYL